MPPLENLGLVADAEFIAHWQQWQSEVGILRREQAKRAPSSLGPTAKRGLDSLAAVLCGEAAALRAATKRWQELLVAVALFQQPTVQAHELQ